MINRIFVLVFIVSPVVLYSGEASAYTRVTVGGNPIYWPSTSLPVPLRRLAATIPDGSKERVAYLKATYAWHRAPSRKVLESKTVWNDGRTFMTMSNGINEISMGPNGGVCGPTMLGCNFRNVNSSTGAISEVDIFVSTTYADSYSVYSLDYNHPYERLVGSAAGGPRSDFLNGRTIFVHELGHAMGLGHAASGVSVMMGGFPLPFVGGDDSNDSYGIGPLADDAHFASDVYSFPPDPQFWMPSRRLTGQSRGAFFSSAVDINPYLRYQPMFPSFVNYRCPGVYFSYAANLSNLSGALDSVRYYLVFREASTGGSFVMAESHPYPLPGEAISPWETKVIGFSMILPEDVPGFPPTSIRDRLFGVWIRAEVASGEIDSYDNQVYLGDLFVKQGTSGLSCL